MSHKLVKVIVGLSLSDVIRLKKKYNQAIINSLPFKLTVGTTTWLVSENIWKNLLGILSR